MYLPHLAPEDRTVGTTKADYYVKLEEVCAILDSYAGEAFTEAIEDVRDLDRVRITSRSKK
jgi:hypothetical protein